MADPSVAELRAARQELDEVISDIQRVDGFEDFLASPDFPDVARAAGDTPLIYLASAERGGVALIVRGERVADIPLAALTSTELRTRTEDYLHRYARFRRSPGSGEHRSVWTECLDDLTRWLWDAAMSPVLDELGDVLEIAVVPCGLLGLLPLHAAWTADPAAPTGRRYAIDRTAFAYTANARALATCRRRAAERGTERVLAVADPHVERGRLPYTRPEAQVALCAFPAGDLLAGEQATIEAVSREMPAADILHLGCHGQADLTDPLHSQVVLAGGSKLELDSIMRMSLRTRLTVLSACETSMPGTGLPDEVVGLPTGLVQAGVAGVVATMWATGQHAGALLMTAFYRHWRGGSPARALATAQRWLRDVTVGELEEEWESALADGAAWLPGQAGDELLSGLLDQDVEATDRPWSGIEVWAAPAFTGA